MVPGPIRASHGHPALTIHVANKLTKLRLGDQRQRMTVVDHRLALGNRPALPSAPDEK